MKRRSESGNFTAEQLYVHLPGPSEHQHVTPIGEIKKRRTLRSSVHELKSKSRNSFHRTRPTRRRYISNVNPQPIEPELITDSPTRLSFVCNGDKTEASDPTKHVQLTEKESRALVKQYRHLLGDKNIVALSVGRKKTKGIEKTTQALVFKVKKKKPLEKLSIKKRIPPSVRFHKDSGETQQIKTDVVQIAGRLVHQAKPGDAVYVRDGKTTVAGIVPYEKKQGEKPVKRLLTSAHLIDFDESRKGEMLHHPDETQPRFPITGFHPVTKYPTRLKRRQIIYASYNQQDILWADVDNTVMVSGNIAGIREPKAGDTFEMTGSSSGVLSGTVKSTNASVKGAIRGRDSHGKFYTYWENMIEYEVPAQEGDSGAGLIAQNDKKLIGIHSIGTVSESDNDSTGTDDSSENSSAPSPGSEDACVNYNETVCYACRLHSAED